MIEITQAELFIIESNFHRKFVYFSNNTVEGLISQYLKISISKWLKADSTPFYSGRILNNKADYKGENEDLVCFDYAESIEDIVVLLIQWIKDTTEELTIISSEIS